MFILNKHLRFCCCFKTILKTCVYQTYQILQPSLQTCIPNPLCRCLMQITAQSLTTRQLEQVVWLLESARVDFQVVESRLSCALKVDFPKPKSRLLSVPKVDSPRKSRRSLLHVAANAQHLFKPKFINLMLYLTHTNAYMH